MDTTKLIINLTDGASDKKIPNHKNGCYNFQRHLNFS